MRLPQAQPLGEPRFARYRILYNQNPSSAEFARNALRRRTRNRDRCPQARLFFRPVFFQTDRTENCSETRLDSVPNISRIFRGPYLFGLALANACERRA